jgi:hypothetical protein
VPVTNLFRKTFVHAPMLAILLLTACKATQHDETIPEVPIQPLQFELPASLERERDLYEEGMMKALGDVSDFFLASGFELPDTRIIDSVTVFDSSSRAREYLANAYGAPLESIPETFSGTVVGERMFLVSRDVYEEIWQKVYPEWPWTDQAYHQLIVHELAHRAHEAIAVSEHGSADAMGPTWFFEGLAVTCAGQFVTGDRLFSHEELGELVGSGRAPQVSYPLYGRIVRSLAAQHGMKVLISSASEAGFPDVLWSHPDTKRHKGI